jgi:hypothetical protein
LIWRSKLSVKLPNGVGKNSLSVTKQSGVVGAEVHVQREPRGRVLTRIARKDHQQGIGLPPSLAIVVSFNIAFDCADLTQPQHHCLPLLREAA